MSTPTFNDVQELHDVLIKRISDRQVEMQKLLDENEDDKNSLETIVQFLKVWRTVNGIDEPVNNRAMVDTTIISPQIRRRKPKNPDRGVVVDKVRELILAAEKPLTRAELFELLAADGIDIHGKDPQMVLSTMLWRSQDSVVRLGSAGYWLAEKPYEPLHYDPAYDDVVGVARREPDGEIIDDSSDQN